MMRGKLLKRSTYLHTWKTRTFELDTGLLVRTLRYFDSHGKLKGEMILNGKRCTIQLMDSSSCGKPHCFALTADDRTIVMSAGSDSAMRKWIDFLSRNGATLMGDAEVEQQELWRSVMEAEERLESSVSHHFVNLRYQQGQQTSSGSNSTRNSVGEFSESSLAGTELEELVMEDTILEEPITGASNSVQRKIEKEMDAIAQLAQDKMMNLGMYKEELPCANAPAKCSIFLSEDWQRCDKLILFVGSSHGGAGGRGVPPGVWSRSGCADMGFKNGSMLSYLEKSQEAGYGAIVLDTATHTNMVRMNGVMEKVPIPGSETAEKHIATVWEKFVRLAQAECLFAIAYGLGGECFKEYLESNTNLLFSNKPPSLTGVALLETSHVNDGITQDSVRRFLRQRSINWQQSEMEFGSILHDNEKTVGCICMSAGKQQSSRTNRAWIIPRVRNSVFRFFDFCIDVDASVGDAGSYYSDRWVSMESSMQH